MIDLQNPYAYEASLNNILKAPLEAGVERVVITLLNDILSHLYKWPGLSAENTSSIKHLAKFKLEYSGRPDGMILDNSVTYQQADGKGAKLQPRALIETKMLGIDPYRKEAVFEGEGAIELSRMIKGGKISADDTTALFEWCSKFKKKAFKTDVPVVRIPNNMPNVAKIVPHWSSNPHDRAYDAGTEFAFTFKDGVEVKLYQLDWYLLDLYYGNCKYVIWTNGWCWKIWTKDASGNIYLDLNISLDKALLGYVKNNNVQIDPTRFRYLIDKLIFFLSTL